MLEKYICIKLLRKTLLSIQHLVKRQADKKTNYVKRDNFLFRKRMLSNATLCFFFVHSIPGKSISANFIFFICLYFHDRGIDDNYLILFAALQIRGTDNGVRPLAVKSL